MISAGRGQHFPQRRGLGARQQVPEEGEYTLIEKLITVNRVSKVHKGGKRLAFNSLAVVGDGHGRVGMALGRANEAADAIRKGFTQAQRVMMTIHRKGGTIPHAVTGRFNASKVLLRPASPGTGIIAGGPIRAVCEACGIRDILTKSLGSSNSVNLVKATLAGLRSLRSAEEMQKRRRFVVEVADGEQP